MAKKKKNNSRPINEMPVEAIVTRELPVIETGTDENYFSYAEQKCINYTYAKHQLYKRADESEDEGFIKEIKTNFSMCDMEYRSCAIDACAMRSAEQENADKIASDIVSLEEKIANEETTLEQKFKYKNKIAKLIRQENANAVFGTVNLLRQLTKTHNKILRAKSQIPKLEREIAELEELLSYRTLSRRDYKRVKYQINCKKQTINRYKELAEKAKIRIPKLKKDLQTKRILEASLVGEANYHGNRFVDFNLEHGILVFKITKNGKYTVHVKIDKGFVAEFKKLQKLIDEKKIAVTVRFTKDVVKLQYDVAIVNGYSVDEKSRRADVKELKNEGYPVEIEKEKIKEIYKQYYAEQTKRMLIDKIEGRCLSIDMNPSEIGYSVLQRDERTKHGFRLIACGRIAWTCLMRRHKNKSSSAKSKKINNKRKNAVALAFKILFDIIAKSYKCSEFIIEDLDFTNEIVNGKSKESNRKCNNLWYRTLSNNIINRRCTETGIRLVKTNACYTSFTGNIKYDFCDATNASIEIGRRGLMRYISGSFYPQMTQEDVDTMTDVAAHGDKGDAHTFTHESWRDAYKSCKEAYEKKSDFEHRYRASLKDCA